MEESSSREEPEVTGGKGGFLKRYLPLINTVSILVGILAGLMHLKEISRYARDTSKFLKISSIGFLTDFTEEYERIQDHRSRFMPEIGARTDEVRKRLEAGETGQSIYHSDSLEDFHEVTRFWERSAAFVELDYFDFDVVYNLKSFPYGLWSDTAEIRQMIGRNWYGKDEPLVDFLASMEGLEKLYRAQDAIFVKGK